MVKGWGDVTGDRGPRLAGNDEEKVNVPRGRSEDIIIDAEDRTNGSRGQLLRGKEAQRRGEGETGRNVREE